MLSLGQKAHFCNVSFTSNDLPVELLAALLCMLCFLVGIAKAEAVVVAVPAVGVALVTPSHGDVAVAAVGQVAQAAVARVVSVSSESSATFDHLDALFANVSSSRSFCQISEDIPQMCKAVVHSSVL